MSAQEDKTHEDLLSSFQTVTGINDHDRARFYLEAAAWNLDIAVESFLEEEENIDDPEDSGSTAHRTARQPTPPRPAQASSHDKKHQKGSKQNTGPQSRIATLNSLSHQSSDSDDDDDDDEDDEEGEAYYAGGSERGAGQQIIGPPKKKGEASKLVESMFKAAKERGAEVVDPMESHGASSSSSTPFRGTAYRLGDSVAPSERLGGADPAESDRQGIEVTLHFWRNGFSIDAGPLREYQSPDNKVFLDSINTGKVPPELLRQARGAPVSLNMHDHRNEDYVKPKVSMQTFSGEGHRLGSPTDATVVAAAAPPPALAASLLTNASNSVNVDTSQPTTSIQIRLTDGSRLVSKFNTSHSISDVRRFIITARPEYSGANFTLMTTFPNKELTDETISLAAAQLLNAVLVLKLNK